MNYYVELREKAVFRGPPFRGWYVIDKRGEEVAGPYDGERDAAETADLFAQQDSENESNGIC